MRPNEKEFKEKVEDKQWRMRMAYLGDSILKTECIRVLMTEYPKASAGRLNVLLGPMVSNERMQAHMKAWGVRIGGFHEGKPLADIFEAWIAYLHLSENSFLATQFCQAYIRSQLIHAAGTGSILSATLAFTEDMETV